MSRTETVCRGVLVASVSWAICAAPVLAQGTLTDYQRAAVFQNARRLVSRLSVEPHWIGQSEQFWYRDEHEGVKTFVLVEPVKNTQGPAFDHARLAAALSSAAGKPYRPQALPFDEFEYRDGPKALVFDVKGEGAGESGGRSWRCELQTYQCAALPHRIGARDGEALSPDGRWAVFLKDHNLCVRDISSGEESALTSDGEPDHDYGSDTSITTSSVSNRLLENVQAPRVYFSPDSQRFLSYRIDARPVQPLALVQTMPVGRPRLHTYRYPMAGDESVARVQMMLFDLRGKTHAPLSLAPMTLLTTYEMQVDWNKRSTQVGFTEGMRGRKIEKLHVVDVREGAVHTAVEERSATYVNRGPLVRILAEGREVLWSSERDGWNHLYRLDGRDGTVKQQLTRGEWVVRGLLHVDESRGWVYFTAGGREPGQDPYYRHLYRVRLDGHGLQRLTPEPADHEIHFAPNGRYFVDTYSRIDAAPVSVLRKAEGRWVRELQRADITRLQAAGWRAPEPFRVKARDGKTDIYGAIFRPTNFDPSRRYPVLDAIYPGPQSIRTPKSFDAENWEAEQALAELGFLVVTIDGLGTPGRSRAFREWSYGNLGDAGGLEDHIAGLQQLAERYPYLDLSRVGIYGHSGGGFASARAVLKYPKFYKVAVSASGNHDQRTYWAEWGERFQGYPVGENFASQANAPLAGDLQGRLLLVYGDLDDNVHPSNTLQLVDALIAANKDFDLLVLPNRNHSLINLAAGKAALRRPDPYFLRRRWDYFVEHLLGVTPPREFPLRLTDEVPPLP